MYKSKNHKKLNQKANFSYDRKVRKNTYRFLEIYIRYIFLMKLLHVDSNRSRN